MGDCETVESVERLSCKMGHFFGSLIDVITQQLSRQLIKAGAL